MADENAPAGAGSNSPKLCQSEMGRTGDPRRKPNGALPRTWLLGLPFDRVTLLEALELIRHSVKSREKLFLSTINVNWVVSCSDDPHMRQSVLESDLCVADGTPLVWLSRWTGAALPERVAGSELINALRRPSTHAPIRLYLFGGPPGIAEKACEQLNLESGGCVAVGSQFPGYGDVESMSYSDCIEQINSARPDFVVVSLGARKGQAWIQRNRQALEAPVIAHLGAAVNFIAGAIPQAPAWIGRLGIEWLWRITQEPSLWRRYGSDALKLTRIVAKHGIRFRYRADGKIEPDHPS